MSDDLVVRLRDCPDMDAVDEAADALEDQAARIAELEAAQNRLLEILDEARNGLCNCELGTMSSSQVEEEIRAALEGGKKDE